MAELLAVKLINFYFPHKFIVFAQFPRRGQYRFPYLKLEGADQPYLFAIRIWFIFGTLSVIHAQIFGHYTGL
jgi:hypothetical protein